MSVIVMKEFFRVTEYCTQIFKKAGCDLLHVKTGEDYVRVLQRFSSAVTDDIMNLKSLIFLLFLFFAMSPLLAQQKLTIQTAVDKKKF